MITIKIPKPMLMDRIKEQAGISDKELQTKVKDKLDQLSGLISEEGALHIIANELGVKVYEETGELQIKNLVAGMRNVQLTGKVVRVYEVREFEKGDRKGKVGAFLLGDETGVVRMVLWNDKADLLKNFKEGQVLKVENGYSRDNRGRLEVHAGDKTTISVEEDADIQVQQNVRKKITDLTENDNDVEIMGTIVQVFDPRFFPVDPDSGRKVTEKDGQYYLNDNKVDNITYSYVTNLFLDDGSDNIRVVCWRNQSQKLFDMSHEDMVKNRDISFEEQKNDLLGKIVKFTGRTNKNDMFDRIEFIPRLVDMDPDPQKEIERLEKQAKKQQEKPAEKQAEEIPTGSYDQDPKETPKQTPQPTAKPVSEQEERPVEEEDIEDIDLSDLDSL